jgi:mRNA interferase MazF
MVRSYVPDAGDIVWISFNPQTGHEQAGHRPAVVLSPAAYNVKTSLMVCCPMTTQIKNYPFEVVIAGASPSAVLADQVKSLDWRKRRAKHKGMISAAELAEVRAKIRTLIGWSSLQFGVRSKARAATRIVSVI